jgi:ribonuclease-3
MDPLARQTAEDAIGHRFSDVALLARSLTHASVSETRVESNERLEFLGDAVLGLVVCQRLFERFPEYLEGDLTKVKSAVVSRQTCAAVAVKLGLPALLTTGKGMKGGSQRIPASLAAGVLESVVAAIFLDGGHEAARQFILKHFEPLIDEHASSGHHENFKSVLQQHAQQFMNAVPVYRTLDEQGPDHAKAFKVVAEVGGRRFNHTWANNKKRAEQQAALEALKELGLVDELPGGGVRIRAQVANAAPASEPQGK